MEIAEYVDSRGLNDWPTELTRRTILLTEVGNCPLRSPWADCPSGDSLSLSGSARFILKTFASHEDSLCDLLPGRWKCKSSSISQQDETTPLPLNVALSALLCTANVGMPRISREFVENERLLNAKTPRTEKQRKEERRREQRPVRDHSDIVSRANQEFAFLLCVTFCFLCDFALKCLSIGLRLRRAGDSWAFASNAFPWAAAMSRGKKAPGGCLEICTHQDTNHRGASPFLAQELRKPMQELPEKLASIRDIAESLEF